MSALTADLANPLLSLVYSGDLAREDIAPSLDSGVAGERASRIFAVSLAEHNAAASLFDLMEARALLGLPASSWAMTNAPVRPKNTHGKRRSPSDLRRNAARHAARMSARSALSA
ncbi:hypothetical protein ASE25_19340 [Terrabacter sp. Root85]|uniref:hypothetical protein n=1 Tax=Terrabacter sp. Root85 TaxID=1736603 RepID=UPI0006F4C760|nr:hypothetical protein [Terrabacter sp. Root85]KRC85206.1 hypothetical protein ASE25_19340 [Terrabacter sp. Root85]